MSSNAARPKRAAEEFARTHQSDDTSAQSSKKPRFDVRNPSALAPDALEEDATLDADVIGGRGQQVRRNAVNIDGYDSDSENEGFDARAETKAKLKEAQSKDEEDNDMFADLEDDLKDGDDSEDEAGRKTGKKKAVRFLNEDEIEGQIQNSKSGGHVSADFSVNGHSGKGKGKAPDNEVDSSSDSDVNDEVRASLQDVDDEVGAGGKKLHAPKLDAFNMRNEQDEGRFDDQGNFVRKAADPDAVHDTWLEGVSKKEMKKAKDAADKRDEERRRRDLENDAVPTESLLNTLILLLDRGETVLEALARLGRRKDKKSKWQRKNKNKNMKQEGVYETDADMEEEDFADLRRRENVEAITGAADLLLTRGQPEIYDAERGLLIRQYRRETGQDWTEPRDATRSDEEASSSAKMWKYKWTDARDGGEIHGPFDLTTMKQWNEAGYFGEGVEFKSDNSSEWTRIPSFD